MSVSGRLFLTLDTGFVCVPHGYTGNIPCCWYSLGHLWTSYIQWCSDFSNRKCCAQYAETETPKRGYGQWLGYSKPTGLDDVIRSDLYFGVRIAVCACSDRSPCSSLSLCSPNSHSDGWWWVAGGPVVYLHTPQARYNDKVTFPSLYVPSTNL